MPDPRNRRAAEWLWIVLVAGLAAPAASDDPEVGFLTGVQLEGSTTESSRIALDLGGPVRWVETMTLDRGRFVFDLPDVAWNGPVRRVRPPVPGVREYRYSQLSRNPLVTRFVVEVVDGWSCRHESAPRGLVVICGGPAAAAPRRDATAGPDVAVVRGIALISPITGLGIGDLVDRSLGYVPHDMVRDGLPNFGAVRDDWLGMPRPHKGLDIYGDALSIQAAAAGTVAGAGVAEKAGGWIKIGHGSGVETVYVHVSKISVRTGDRVAKGQRIAVVSGASGNAVEPQLHFEIKLDGESVDPVPYFYEAAPAGVQRKITAANRRLESLKKERAALVRRGVE